MILKIGFVALELLEFKLRLTKFYSHQWRCRCNGPFP